MAPQAGVTLTVRAGGVTRGPAELGRAIAGAHGAVTGQKPAANCRGRRLSQGEFFSGEFQGHLMGEYTTDESTYSVSNQTADCHCFDPGPPGGHS